MHELLPIQKSRMFYRAWYFNQGSLIEKFEDIWPKCWTD